MSTSPDSSSAGANGPLSRPHCTSGKRAWRPLLLPLDAAVALPSTTDDCDRAEHASRSAGDILLLFNTASAVGQRAGRSLLRCHHLSRRSHLPLSRGVGSRAPVRRAMGVGVCAIHCCVGVRPAPSANRQASPPGADASDSGKSGPPPMAPVSVAGGTNRGFGQGGCYPRPNTAADPASRMCCLPLLGTVRVNNGF